MMGAPHADQLVNDYLGKLDTALAALPRSRREEILDEISNHIAEERGQLSNESDADVRNLLDRVGDPAEVADAARVETVDAPVLLPRRRIGALEVFALVLTPLIWPAGVILLWLSPAWKLRDKLIGTLVPPGGYLILPFVVSIVIVAGHAARGCSATFDSQGNVITDSCAPAWQNDLIVAAAVGLALLLLALPVLTAIYLVRRARKWSAEPQ